MEGVEEQGLIRIPHVRPISDRDEDPFDREETDPKTFEE